MVFSNFITTAQRGIFDVRHYITVGYGVMAFVLVLISQTNLQARVIDPSANFNPKKIATTENTAIPRNFKLTLLEKNTTKDTPRLTRLASLNANAEIAEYSPKDRTSCSLEAAKAAARGDTSKISPCIEALLSGDEDALVNMPEKMSAFFIEAMNDPNAAENMPNIMINSMMKMMEAMSAGVKDNDENAPEKTAATAKTN